MPGGSSGSGNPNRCTPGESVGCIGVGACNGFQVCLADGTFGACNCGAGAGGSGAGGAGVGGAGGGPDPNKAAGLFR